MYAYWSVSLYRPEDSHRSSSTNYCGKHTLIESSTSCKLWTWSLCLARMTDHSPPPIHGSQTSSSSLFWTTDGDLKAPNAVSSAREAGTVSNRVPCIQRTAFLDSLACNESIEVAMPKRSTIGMRSVHILSTSMISDSNGPSQASESWKVITTLPSRDSGKAFARIWRSYLSSRDLPLDCTTLSSSCSSPS